MKKIEEVINNGDYGLYYGNRLLLPIKATVLKIVFDNEIYMDFSPKSEFIHINQTDYYLEIYFCEEDNLSEIITKYENIKLVLVEDGDDIFDFGNHKKVGLQLESGHKLKIIDIDEDILFIE